MSLTMVLLLTLAAFAVAMLAMVIGVLLRGRCLRGSCGGPEAVGPDGEPLGCGGRCRRRTDAEPSPETNTET